MPLDEKFLKSVEPLDSNWSMGVELVSPLLYSLVRCVRPRNVLEVGAGYSSPFILQALADNREEYLSNQKLINGQVRSDKHKGWRRLLKGQHPLPLGEPEYYQSGYEPMLTVIDDRSHPATSAHKVEQVAEKLGLRPLLRFQEGDFRGMSKRFEKAQLPLDFIWFDCGLLREFLAEYWELLNPRGGMLLIHSPLTNAAKLAALTDFQERQAREQKTQFEMLSLLEPHKWRQNSVTLIRKLERGMELAALEPADDGE